MKIKKISIFGQVLEGNLFDDVNGIDTEKSADKFIDMFIQDLRASIIDTFPGADVDVDIELESGIERDWSITIDRYCDPVYGDGSCFNWSVREWIGVEADVIIERILCDEAMYIDEEIT